METIEIKNKYKEIKSNLTTIKNKSYNDIDVFLDRVNLLKRNIIKLTISVNELNDLLFSVSDNDKLIIYNLRKEYKSLIDALNFTYLKYENSEYKEGIIKVLQGFRLAISNFAEIIDDTIFFFEADNNKELADIFNKIADA